MKTCIFITIFYNIYFPILARSTGVYTTYMYVPRSFLFFVGGWGLEICEIHSLYSIFPNSESLCEGGMWLATFSLDWLGWLICVRRNPNWKNDMSVHFTESDSSLSARATTWLVHVIPREPWLIWPYTLRSFPDVDFIDIMCIETVGFPKERKLFL